MGRRCPPQYIEEREMDEQMVLNEINYVYCREILKMLLKQKLITFEEAQKTELFIAKELEILHVSI